MSADPGIQACAELVARGDPDRFRATMAAPVSAREVLFPLYAFNLEVARAPWATSEPMIAEMRLQFWRDVIEESGQGIAPRTHEVAEPFGRLVREKYLDINVLDGIVEARRHDIYPDPFEDEAAFEVYLDRTGGSLMWVAACALGVAQDHETAVRAYGRATAIAGLFLALPELLSRGRRPLFDDSPDGIKTLAQSGLQGLRTAQQARLPHAVFPALWAGWRAKTLLTRALENPNRVHAGALPESGFARDFALLRNVWLRRC